MELDGAVIFWLITIGLIMGAISKLVMWKTEINLVKNLVMGVVGSVIIGSLMASLNLPGSLLLATLGTAAVLFILNVFNQQSEVNY